MNEDWTGVYNKYTDPNWAAPEGWEWDDFGGFWSLKPEPTEDPTWVDVRSDASNSMMWGETAHKRLRFRMPYITHVDGNLWQGGVTRGLLLPNNIKNVLSLYKWEDYQIEHDLDNRIVVTMYDAEGDVDRDLIIELATTVNKWSRQGPTLVHCQAGLNRSSLVVGTALILNGWEPQEAVDHIRAQRSEACLCNDSFEEFLLNFYKKPRHIPS